MREKPLYAFLVLHQDEINALLADPASELVLEGATVHEISDVILGGVPAKKIVFQGDLHNEDSTDMMTIMCYRYFYVMDRTVYGVFIDYALEQHSVYEPIWEAIMDSYRITATDRSNAVNSDSYDIVFFRMGDSRPLSEILTERLPRICVIENSKSIDLIVSSLEPGTYELIILPALDFQNVLDLLWSGEIDAFLDEGIVDLLIISGLYDLDANDVYGDDYVMESYKP